MLIASIIFGGVISVVQTSRTTFANEEETSFIQENIRYAVEILSRDIRLAGSFGCADMRGSARISMVNNAHSGLFSPAAIEAYEGVSGVNFPAVFSGRTEGTDAIVLRYADPGIAKTIAIHSANRLMFHSPHDFNTGDNLVVVDSSCRHLGFFQNTSNGNTHVEFAAGGNSCTSEIFADSSIDCGGVETSLQLYRGGSEVMPFIAHAYYIDDSNLIPGLPALKRRSLTGSGYRAEELAQGVESMNLRFGVDTDTVMDGDVDAFLNADEVTDWSTVIAVRFSFVFRSQSEVYDVARAVTLNGVATNDRFLRQLASSTVRMRNR